MKPYNKIKFIFHYLSGYSSLVQFVDLLLTYKAGEQINMTLYRNGKKMVKPVKLMTKPDTELR